MKRNAGIARKHRGFTLMELMLSIAVLGILTAVAVPSFTQMINRNRLASQSNELLAAIQYARMEAIRTSARVTFCGTDDAAAEADGDCSEGEHSFWVVIGTTGSGQEQLRVFEVEEPLKVSTGLELVTFGADGLARDSDTQALVTGEITVCLETTRPAQNKRVLNIASGSRMIINTPAEDGGGACS